MLPAGTAAARSARRETLAPGRVPGRVPSRVSLPRAGSGHGPAAPFRGSPGAGTRGGRAEPSSPPAAPWPVPVPVPVPVGARGIGRCRRGVAGASGPLPVPSRSRRAGVDRAGNRPVPPRREAVPPRPHPGPRYSRYPLRPVSRYPPRYCCGTSPAAPVTVVPPLLLQPPVPPTSLVLCPSRVPLAPRAPDIPSPSHRTPGLSLPLPSRAVGAAGVDG